MSAVHAVVLRPLPVPRPERHPEVAHRSPIPVTGPAETIGVSPTCTSGGA